MNRFAKSRPQPEAGHVVTPRPYGHTLFRRDNLTAIMSEYYEETPGDPPAA